ncbi:MAG: TetR/AcrR family transcriptional regulator C-terminal domain-containing protein, partial [Acidimicrobiales bacterium]
LQDEPETLLAKRFDELAGQGALTATDTHRAAQHFFALTFLLALDVTLTTPAEAADIDLLLVDGVDVFLRAYRGYP